MKRFWNWINQTEGVRTLELDGAIAEESWLDDDVTPQVFREELNSGTGDIIIWINSPGGDCVAASRIYNMLCNKLTVYCEVLSDDLPEEYISQIEEFVEL